MISVAPTRIAIELTKAGATAVVARVANNRCIMQKLVQVGNNGSGGKASSTPAAAFIALRKSLNGSFGRLAASIIIPVEYTIALQVMVPSSADQDRDSWIEWELSKAIPDCEGGLLFESNYVQDEVSGDFRVHFTDCVRQSYISELIAEAVKCDFYPDMFCFPRRLWKHLAKSILNERGTDFNLLVHKGNIIDLVMFKNGEPTLISIEAYDMKDPSFSENVQTLIARRGGKAKTAPGYYIDGHSGASMDFMSFTEGLGFVPMDHSLISRALGEATRDHGPALLPFAALGVL